MTGHAQSDQMAPLSVGVVLLKLLAPVVHKVDNAIHQINHYPADSVVCFVNTYLLDGNLSSG